MRQPRHSPTFLLFSCVLALLATAGSLVHAQKSFRFEAALDPFVTLPSAWEITPDKLEELFANNKNMDMNPRFKWLTKDRSRALFQRRPFSNVAVDLTLFSGEVPIDEATIDFLDGKFLGMTVSIFNRGDGGKLDAGEFDRRLKITGKEIGSQLGIRPFRREARPAQGLLTEGWIWVSGAGMAVLEHNPEATSGNVEFLRLRLARRDAKGAYAAAMQTRAGASVRLSDLPANVERDDDGNVYVKNVPMLDQGQKGYCVVTSTQRLFEYYGIACDQHQLAQISGANPNTGTSVLSITNELGAIDHLFKTRFAALAVSHKDKLHELVDEQYVGDKVEDRKFHKYIRDYIDDGIPLLWSLELGKYDEDPSIAQQDGGGHMRIIIGYNDKTNRVIFTDSWGAGHEFKTMDDDDCLKATQGLFLLKPTVN